MSNEDKQLISGILSELANSDLDKVVEGVSTSTPEIEPEYQEAIDLRDIYPDSCSPIYHNQRVHYLDKDTTRYFQQLLRQNNDSYTKHIHDSVIKYASSVIPKEEIEESYTVKPPIVIPAGYSQNRHESRMKFATDVEIEMPSGTLIESRSADISAHGIQLKVQQLLDVITGMELRLTFPQLEEQHEQDFGEVIYIVQKYTVGSLYMSLFLSRKDPGTSDFDIFIEEFIKSKIHRYRIDYEDSALALFSKAWEYLYIKALPYVACFVSTAKESIQIHEVAISESNQRQLLGLGQSMLSLIEETLTTTRLNSIANQNELSPEIYSYRIRNDGINRSLCATSWQFKEASDKVTYLCAGIEQETFVAWRIEVVKLKDLPPARSAELLSRLKEESEEQSQNLVEQLNQQDYLIYLVDISDQIKRDPLLENAAQADEIPHYFFDEFEIKSRKAKDYTRLRLGIAKRRNESRYIYATPVLVKIYGEKIKAQTVDFSINGLKIITDMASRFSIRDRVTLEFTGFNRKFRSAKLKAEPYRVVAITKNGYVCLCRDHRVAQHKAAMFLKKLIDRNIAILEHCTGEEWMGTKVRLIEAWMHQCLPTQGLLVSRRKNHYQIPYIIESETTPEILKPFAIGDKVYDFKALFQQKRITDIFRRIVPEHGFVINQEIYVTQLQGGPDDIEVRFWSDFESDLARAEYVREQIKLPVFKAYHLAYSKVPKLDKSDLKADMDVIRKNARHRLSDFQKTYNSLVGIMEFTDVTDSIKHRYNFGNSLSI